MSQQTANVPPTDCDRFGDFEDDTNNLYGAVAGLLIRDFGSSLVLPASAKDLGNLSKNDDKAKLDALRQLVCIYGLALCESLRDPAGGRTKLGKEDPWIGLPTGGEIPPISDPPDATKYIQVSRRFVERITALVAEYKANRDLFDAVYQHLREAVSSKNKATGVVTHTTRPSQVAEVSRRLIEEGATTDDEELGIRAIALLQVAASGGIQGRASAIEVDLPNLEDDATADIIKDNVNAVAAIYFSAMLEDLKFYSVADKVVEQFMQGMVPLSRGIGGESIYEYFKAAPQRLTEAERRTIYAQTLGIAGGSVEVQLPNREFMDLWIRFLSTASSYNRQNQNVGGLSKLVVSGAIVTEQQVFKSARDLAVNISLHGYGIGHFAAVELQKLARTVKAMLSYDDVIAAYGVKDVWQLVERVSSLYLGGSVNGVRQRTMAQAGSKIIAGLAERASILSATDAVIKVDGDFGKQIEHWLAVTGTDDTTTDKYSSPVAVSNQPTIPPTFQSGGMAGADALREAFQKVGSLTGNGMTNMAKA